jgi:hypothetical protein
MTEDVNAFVRVTYYNALRSQRDETAAFQRCIDVLLGRQPSLSAAEARREVAAMLGVRAGEKPTR